MLSKNSSDKIVIESKSSGYYNIQGKWVDSDEFSSKYTDFIVTTSGEKFLYRGLGEWNAAGIVWYDKSKNVISYEQYGIYGKFPTEVVVIAPENAEYVRFFSFAGINSDVVLEVSYYNEKIPISSLAGKKIVYDGDSICYGAGYGDGYARLIADNVKCEFDNQAHGGARLVTLGEGGSFHSIVDNLKNLPKDGDLYCFQGGINDYWTNSPLGTFDYDNFDDEVDVSTVCGALETIFRYSLNNFVGKPICFVITHKIQQTAYNENAEGDTFEDYHDAMIAICKKYSIPYYDAFCESGLNGWNIVQSNTFLTGSASGEPDGIHPNEEGYKRYYVPQLINLFEKIMPFDNEEE